MYRPAKTLLTLATCLFASSSFALSETRTPAELDPICTKLETSPTAKSYLDRARKIRTLWSDYLEAFSPGMDRNDAHNQVVKVLVFDTREELLYNWSRSRVIKDNEIWFNGGDRLLDTALLTSALNYCFGKFVVNDSDAIALYATGGVSPDYFLRNYIASVGNTVRSHTQTERTLASDGTIIEQSKGDLNSALTQINLYHLPGGGTMRYTPEEKERNSNFAPVLPIALILGGEKAAASVGQEVFQRMDHAIAQMQKVVSARQPRLTDQERTTSNHSAQDDTQPSNWDQAMQKWRPRSGLEFVHNPPIRFDAKNQQNYAFKGRVVAINDNLLPNKTRLSLVAQHPKSSRVHSIIYVDVANNTIINGDYGMNSELFIIGKYKSTHQETPFRQVNNPYIARFDAYFVDTEK